VQQPLNGRAAPAGASIPHRRAATLRARGVITGLDRCAAAGVLSPDAMRELNDFYRDRVELPLETASVLESSAQTIRRVVGAMVRIKRLHSVLRVPGQSMYGDLTGGSTTLPR
jgi:hypothetical protein